MQPLLLISYGAPEQQEDVVPFLNNLFAGKNVPAERVAAAVQKYERFAAKTGRYSPLNSECRKLIAGVRQMEPDLPIYWGNLFWHPLLTDAVAEMARDGIERAVCFATSAFDSPPGNQRYADALEAARQAVGDNVARDGALILEKLPLPFDHPLFIEAQADRLLEALTPTLSQRERGQLLAGGTPAPSMILFSAHSISLADAARCQYVQQLQSTCRAVIEQVSEQAIKWSGTSTPWGAIPWETIPWELVYQSRSGAADGWLGPDIKERLRELAAAGQCRSVIVSPIGFFCENMETEYDLDIEIGECCAELGLSFYRAKAVGAMPKICRLLCNQSRPPSKTANSGYNACR